MALTPLGHMSLTRHDFWSVAIVVVTQNKSKTQITRSVHGELNLLLLNIMGHNMVFINDAITAITTSCSSHIRFFLTQNILLFSHKGLLTLEFVSLFFGALSLVWFLNYLGVVLLYYSKTFDINFYDFW